MVNLILLYTPFPFLHFSIGSAQFPRVGRSLTSLSSWRAVASYHPPDWLMAKSSLSADVLFVFCRNLAHVSRRVEDTSGNCENWASMWAVSNKLSSVMAVINLHLSLHLFHQVRHLIPLRQVHNVIHLQHRHLPPIYVFLMNIINEYLECFQSSVLNGNNIPCFFQGAKEHSFKDRNEGTQYQFVTFHLTGSCSSYKLSKRNSNILILECGKSQCYKLIATVPLY